MAFNIQLPRFLGFQQDTGLGNTLGQGLAGATGQGIGSFLETLAQSKLREMQQAQQAKQITPLLERFGLSGLENTPTELLAPVLKAKTMEPQNAAYAQALSSLLGGQQGVQIPGGISGEQATKLASLGLQKQQTEEASKLRREQFEEKKKQFEIEKQTKAQEKLEERKLKRQAQIEKHNAPYIKAHNEDVSIAKRIQSLGSRMEELLNTGKVYSGLKGQTLGRLTATQNDETQEFETLANELATIMASKSGVATNFKIKLAQQSKPNVQQTSIAQRKILNNVLRQANTVLKEDQALNAILDENKGIMPINLKSLVTKKAKSLVDLPDASEYSDDAIIKIGNQKYEKSGNNWNPID